MCEHSSVAQATALRREARRRKILENSTSRLKLIEGMYSSVERPSSETSLELKPKPEVRASENNDDADALDIDNNKASVYTKLNDIIKESEELQDISNYFMRESKELDEDEVDEESTIEIEEKRGKSLVEILLEKKLHYVLLAVTVNALLFFNVGYLFYENIFCPFYTAKTIEIISRRRTNDKEEFQPVLFLVMAGLPKSIQKFTKTFVTILLSSLSDLCLYIFTFVIGAKMINTQV